MKPMTHRLQYIMERASIAASATNPHWHMQPLTLVYGESGPPVWMQRITMAWHSLWINCASWHTQLTVSNSACDLCTAAPNILLEWSHKSTAAWLTLYAIIHTPCFNCPIWRWCKYDHTFLLCLFHLLAHTQIHANLLLERINILSTNRICSDSESCREGSLFDINHMPVMTGL